MKYIFNKVTPYKGVQYAVGDETNIDRNQALHWLITGRIRRLAEIDVNESPKSADKKPTSKKITKKKSSSKKRAH